MAAQVLLPKLGNSVESSILVNWLKQPGDHVEEGETLCTIETDKATMDVPSTAAGMLLQHLVSAGDDVPVQAPIALIGDEHAPLTPAPLLLGEGLRISPRARKLAQKNDVDVSQITGTGPGRRIIERDMQAKLPLPEGKGRGEGARMTPVAKAMIERGGYTAPERGSGPGGRIIKEDLAPIPPSPLRGGEGGGVLPADYETIPLPNIRRVIAERMHVSLQSTAQLTMHASADARALLGYRKRLKVSDESLGLRGVTMNDLVLFATARTLPSFPQLNATFEKGELRHYQPVHLGFAVDTPRGLLVPVIRSADGLTLKQLAGESNRLAKTAQAGRIAPDALSGGTFTVTNLGSLGIESFTPILNAPQVAILGVGNVNLKAIAAGQNSGVLAHHNAESPQDETPEVSFAPHIGLSLTIDHQVVDGAPGAKFLQALARNLAQIELLLAL